MSDRAERKKAPRRYVSRPQGVEAVQWTGDPKSFYEVSRLTGNDKATITDDDGPTLDLMILAGKDGAQKWVPVPVDHWSSVTLATPPTAGRSIPTTSLASTSRRTRSRST